MGGVGIIDINHMAIWKAIEEYEVKDRVGCFEKVLKVFEDMKERTNKKNASKKQK